MGKWINAKGWLDGYGSKRELSQPAGQEDDSYGVVFYPIRCPRKECRSKNTKCYKSSPPIRYHICNDCGYRFKSWEAKD